MFFIERFFLKIVREWLVGRLAIFAYICIMKHHKSIEEIVETQNRLMKDISENKISLADNWLRKEPFSNSQCCGSCNCNRFLTSKQ